MLDPLDIDMREAHAFVDKILRQPRDVLRSVRISLGVVTVPASEVDPFDIWSPLKRCAAMNQHRDDVVIAAVAGDVESAFAILSPGIRVRSVHEEGLRHFGCKGMVGMSDRG